MSVRRQESRLPTDTELEYFSKNFPNLMLGAVIDQYQGANLINCIPRYKQIEETVSKYEPHQGQQECARRLR